jgi:Zn-dependent protease with chaperone function
MSAIPERRDAGAPGPVDRTTFFEEQARHRRRTLRFAVVSALAVLAAGLPISLLVSPVLYLVVLLVAHLIQLATPLPAGFWSLAERAGSLVPTLLDQVDRGFQTSDWTGIDLAAVARMGVALVLPGMAFTVVVWLWVRALLARVGVGGVLSHISARAPNPNDLEERQLANVVEEMGIAGGLRRPELLVLDVPEPNAAAIGRDRDDAAIVVTRGLLERLDRDETQGVIGHLIGSVGNGDLRIAWLLLSVFQTYTLLAILLHAPTSRTARRNAWRALRGLFRRDPAELARVADLLLSDDSTKTVGESAEPRGVFFLLRIPFLFAAATVHLLTMLGTWLAFGPALGALWRARRYLADATAVQLTRNPHGLANALHRLEHAGGFAAGTASQLLFIVWGGRGSGGAFGYSIPGGLHPTVARRVRRLEATGARITRISRQTARLPVAPPSWIARIAVPFVAILVVLTWIVTAAAAVLLIGVTIFLSALSLAFTAFGIAFVHWFFENLPRFPAMARQALELGRDLLRLITELVKLAGG